jgi:hypothetical protein
MVKAHQAGLQITIRDPSGIAQRALEVSALAAVFATG